MCVNTYGTKVQQKFLHKWTAHLLVSPEYWFYMLYIERDMLLAELFQTEGLNTFWDIPLNKTEKWQG